MEFAPGTHVYAHDGKGEQCGIVDPDNAWIRDPLERKRKEEQGFVWVRFLSGTRYPKIKAYFIPREWVRKALPTLQVYEDE